MLRATSWIWSSLILAGWLVAAPSSLAQKKDPKGDPPQKVNDEAGLFSKVAVHAANEEIAAIKNAYQKDLLIETREKGKDNLKEFRQWAEEQAKEHRVEGIYILITKVPKHFEIMVGKQTPKSGLFNIGDEQELLKILKENLAKKPDEALRLSVHHVRAAFCRGQPKESIAALFDGIPADLRSKVRDNSVRRDRVNDWLGDHVNGKGKIIELQVPVQVAAARSKDGTYEIIYTVGASKAGKGKGGGAFGGAGPGGLKATALGDEWSLDLNLGVNKPEMYWLNQLDLAGVSASDAEKLVELKEVTIKAKIQEAKLVNAVFLRLTLAEIQVDGKKVTPRKREPAKVAPPERSPTGEEIGAAHIIPHPNRLQTAPGCQPGVSAAGQRDGDSPPGVAGRIGPIHGFFGHLPAKSCGSVHASASAVAVHPSGVWRKIG